LCSNLCINPVQPSGKSQKKSKTVEVVTDLESDNSVGSVFTKQWPEMRHVFQSENLEKYLEPGVAGFVSEKLDGSNLAVTSRGVVSSRRNILMKEPSAAELEKFKFSGVTLSKLVGVFDKLATLEKHFQGLFPFLDVEVVVYGELIQKGTATCKEDKFHYRPRGIEPGEFHIFGAGISFQEKLNTSQIGKAKQHLKENGYSVISHENDLTEKIHLVLLMNEKLSDLLRVHGFKDVVNHEKMNLLEALSTFSVKLLNNAIEGVVINFGEEILKWKGLDESYPDMFIEQINALEKNIHVDAFVYIKSVANKAREEREKLRKEKVTEILLERAYKSAMTKMRSLEDHAAEGELTDAVITGFKKVLEEEMMKDCHSNVEYEQKLEAFITSKIKW